MSFDEPGSVDFEPAPLRPRRRRVDPLLLGAAVVVIGLVAAIVKPWDGGDEPGIAAVPSESPAPTVRPSPTLPPSAVRVLDALRPHDAWGIRAVTGDASMAERWIPLDDAGEASRSGTVGGRDESIVALGITTPGATVPLDVRVSRPTAEGDQEWLEVRRVAPRSPDGNVLLWPPGSDGSVAATWPAGRYRIELLMGRDIERVDVSIPGRFERLPADRPASVGPAGTARTLGIGPMSGPPGLFIVARDLVERLDVRPVAPLDEAGVWRSSVSEGGNRSEVVAAIFRPLATGIGVQLPADSTSVEAAIRRLAPDPDWLAQDQVTVVDLALDRADHHVVFWAPSGRPWPAGTYAVDVAWDDKDGHHASTWHLSLLPGGAA